MTKIKDFRRISLVETYYESVGLEHGEDDR